MKRHLLLFLIAAATVRGEPRISFDDYFLDQALRIDLYLFGNAKQESVAVDRLVQEGAWPENPGRLLDPFNNGRYTVKVVDVASNRLVYSRGFDCMFGEYRTTQPALDGQTRVYERSVRIPFPRRPVWFLLESRDRRNLPVPLFRERIDPSDTAIILETPDAGDRTFGILENGDPKRRVDLVFVAEGYVKADSGKFQGDACRFADILFGTEPFKSRKAAFNIRGVLRPSPEPAMDEPRQGRYKKTVLDASFNAFGLDRYMLISKNHRLREIAGQVPYDAIVVLVNAARYGGGGIYNDYAVTTVDNDRSPMVFIHEFGHSFAGLADEYYASDVAYNDFYPKDVEPLEPNITALLDPAHPKWADLLSPGVRVPTEYAKEAFDSLEALQSKNRKDREQGLKEARSKNASERALKSLEERFERQAKELEEKIKKLRACRANLVDKVGAFEGAGYATNGLYRPMVYCLMIHHPKNEFCRVCQRAVERMIDYYSE